MFQKNQRTNWLISKTKRRTPCAMNPGACPLTSYQLTPFTVPQIVKLSGKITINGINQRFPLSAILNDGLSETQY